MTLLRVALLQLLEIISMQVIKSLLVSLILLCLLLSLASLILLVSLLIGSTTIKLHVHLLECLSRSVLASAPIISISHACLRLAEKSLVSIWFHTLLNLLR